jgi:PIF1-like helicase
MLLQSLRRQVRDHSHPNNTNCLITSTIGIAACNIGGVTIHSFAGIGLGIENAEDLASKVRKNKKANSRWMRTKVLIIDEGAYNFVH